MGSFLKARWLQLLCAIPAAIAAAWIYGALAALLTPRPSSDWSATIDALQAFREATAAAEMQIGWIAFFSIIAYVIWKWRSSRTG